MKKILTALLMLATVATATAQNTNTSPNRIVVNSGWNQYAYAIDNVDSISFARVDGEVKANVTFQKFATGDADTIWVGVQRTPECESFSIDILPTNTAKQYSDETVATYFSRQNAQKFYQDFESGQLTGFSQELKGNTDYTILTMGYDRYGVACEASRAEFTTPKTPTVGNPSVSYTIDSVGATEFTITVTANDDCQEFYWCQFDKGTAQQQYEMWGPMLGFANMEDMIKQFSMFPHTGTESNTWNGLMPNSEYEVYILPVDVEGNYGDMVVIPITTTKMGGEGTATMTITIGNFGGDAEWGYYQYVTFTPNDQAGIHHDMIMTKEYYDENYTDETILDVLKSDTNPFNPFDSYWDQTGVDEGAWNADPSTTYYAISLAKNINDEWGPLAKVEYTTPSVSSPIKKNISIPVRKAAKVKKGGVVPSASFSGVSLAETAK